MKPPTFDSAALIDQVKRITYKWEHLFFLIYNYGDIEHTMIKRSAYIFKIWLIKPFYYYQYAKKSKTKESPETRDI